MRANPIVSGTVMALASAAAFGSTTPLVQRFGRGVGPFTTAAVLYAGAALVSATLVRREQSSWPRRDALRVAVVALLGAVVAPMALAWGLQRTSGVSASLLLNLEAVFTVLLARAIWREPIGGRIALAVTVIVAGGVVLLWPTAGVSRGEAAAAGSLAVVAATLAWAADNVIGRPLADRDPARVVLAKSALGAALSAVLGRALGEHAPGLTAGLALGACGAVGYGASLHLYLRAQRALGAARTGSIFAAAPFLGAALAWVMGEGRAGAAPWVAGALCAAGVWLHLTEAHEHDHFHDAFEHDHMHRHDDGHHDHVHAREPRGAHSHPHEHHALRHTHAHAPDLHHGHDHTPRR